jgi:TPR repeat protein
MTRIAACLAPCLTLCLVGALTLAVSRPARADSAQLQWQYECLKNPDAVCFDATPSGADPLAPKPVAVAVPAEEPTAASPAAAGPPAAPARKQAAKSPPPAAAADPLAAIAGRLQAGKPTAADMAALQARAKQGHPRALELLAWAELVGVGVPRDPVQAYFHYGMAAAAGVPTGRRDQAAIFSGSLTNEERQQILVIENGNIASGRP